MNEWPWRALMPDDALIICHGALKPLPLDGHQARREITGIDGGEIQMDLSLPHAQLALGVCPACNAKQSRRSAHYYCNRTRTPGLVVWSI
jgi:hypothetical protein